MIFTVLRLLAVALLACTASNCKLPTCPDCGDCVKFCDCR